MDNVEYFRRLLTQLKPDCVLSHWPVDTHFDHRCAADLVLSVFRSAEPRFELYYFEVETGIQTMLFHPSHYVNISSVRDTKHAALVCHRSQDPETVWKIHDHMHVSRGRKCGCAYAEAFLRLDRTHTVNTMLPVNGHER